MLDFHVNTGYSFLWNKYRPVLLKLMIDAADSPQQYKFSSHEFKNANPKEKKGHSFLLYVHKSRSLTNIKTSQLAIDLLAMLKQSKTAVNLTESASYEFMLDKKFVLHVTKAVTQAVEPVVEPTLEAVTA